MGLRDKDKDDTLPGIGPPTKPASQPPITSPSEINRVALIEQGKRIGALGDRLDNFETMLCEILTKLQELREGLIDMTMQIDTLLERTAPKEADE